MVKAWVNPQFANLYAARRRGGYVPGTGPYLDRPEPIEGMTAIPLTPEDVADQQGVVVMRLNKPAKAERVRATITKEEEQTLDIGNVPFRKPWAYDAETHQLVNAMIAEEQHADPTLTRAQALSRVARRHFDRQHFDTQLIPRKLSGFDA